MKLNTKEISFIALFAVLIAVGAFIKIPFFIVPITLQTLFVICSALILGRKLGTLSIIVYLVIGLLGLPIFAKGGGLMYIFQPTFGYLIGFIFTAYFIGSFKDKFNVYLVSFIGILITYGFGLAYFVFLQKYMYGLTYEFSFLIVNLFLIFLPGDFLSCLLAIEISKRIKKYNNI